MAGHAFYPLAQQDYTNFECLLGQPVRLSWYLYNWTTKVHVQLLAWLRIEFKNCDWNLTNLILTS